MKPFGRAAPFIHCRPEDERMTKHWMVMISSVLCAACATGAEPRPDSGTTPVTGRAPPTRIPEPVESALAPQGAPVTPAEMPRAVREAVVADAARRFKVEPSAVV